LFTVPIVPTETQFSHATQHMLAIYEDKEARYPLSLCLLARHLALVCAFGADDPQLGGTLMCIIGKTVSQIYCSTVEPLQEAINRADSEAVKTCVNNIYKTWEDELKEGMKVAKRERQRMRETRGVAPPSGGSIPLPDPEPERDLTDEEILSVIKSLDRTTDENFADAPSEVASKPADTDSKEGKLAEKVMEGGEPARVDLDRVFRDDGDAAFDEMQKMMAKFSSGIPSLIKQCSSCGKREDGKPGDPWLQRCMRCKAEWYCGKACQVADWERHKVYCRKR